MGIGRYLWGAEKYTTLVNHGEPSKRVDIAILGDGYTKEQQAMYEEDVQKIVTAFHEIEPTATYIRHFNFHRVNVFSLQEGCDDRWQKPPVKVKSALGAHFSFLNQRRLVGWDWRVWQVARRAGVPFDHLLVTVNTPRRGGATRFWMTVGWASRNSSDFPRIMIHESGHSIAKLMDEYTGELPDLPFLKGRSLPNFLPFANVTTNGKTPHWREWIDPETPLPTPVVKDETPQGLVGAFEGAAYVNFGAYRPTVDCLMERHSQPFCPVCQEQWIKRIYRKTAIADGFSPTEDVRCGVGEAVTFAADVVKPAQIETVWRVRDPQGNWRVAQSSADYAPLTTPFGQAGKWAVECRLTDQNDKIRQARVKKSTEQIGRWVVMVR